LVLYILSVTYFLTSVTMLDLQTSDRPMRHIALATVNSMSKRYFR